MRSRRQLRSAFSLRGCLVAVMACAVALAFSSRAFASAPMHLGTTSRPQGNALPGAGTRANFGPHPAVGNASWHVASCAAFLLVSGAQAVWARRIQTSRAVSRKVLRVATACQAAAPSTASLPSIPTIAPAAAELPSSAPVQLPKSMNTDAAPALMCERVLQGSSPLLVESMSFVAGAAPGLSPGAAPRATRRGTAARRIGAARCKSARKATSSAAPASETTSRRSVGGKLLSAPVSEIACVSFDASKVRTKIQVGLRNKAITRSASAKESKTAASGVAASTGSRMYVEVSGFATINTDESKKSSLS